MGTIFIGLLFYTRMFPNKSVEQLYDLVAFCLLMVALTFSVLVVVRSVRERWQVQKDKSQANIRLAGRQVSREAQGRLDRAPRFMFHIVNKLLHDVGGDAVPLSSIREFLGK